MLHPSKEVVGLCLQSTLAENDLVKIVGSSIAQHHKLSRLQQWLSFSLYLLPEMCMVKVQILETIEVKDSAKGTEILLTTSFWVVKNTQWFTDRSRQCIHKRNH